MRHPVPRNTKLRPAGPVERQQTICVVDPRPEDYQTWQATAESHGLQLKFVASAEEALRLVRVERVDLWVVSTALPGLSGFDLCGMLRGQSAHAPVFLVAAEYSVEAEQAAWRARASMFGCKPEHTLWLDAWWQSRREGPARRCVALAQH